MLIHIRKLGQDYKFVFRAFWTLELWVSNYGPMVAIGGIIPISRLK